MGSLKDLRKRSFGLAILVNGTSSKRAQEHSTTARPEAWTMSRSDGETGDVPFGLEVYFEWSILEMKRRTRKRLTRLLFLGTFDRP
jgi:hypothetical protein